MVLIASLILVSLLSCLMSGLCFAARQILINDGNILASRVALFFASMTAIACVSLSFCAGYIS